jgi:hypothetical protein
MAPIEGVVVASYGLYLKIRLISGRTIHIPKAKDLAFGDKVWICFNYTDMSVKEIFTDYEYHELDKDAEIEIGAKFDPETGFVEGVALNDSVFLSD